jgi:hypothetical protein
MIVEFVRERRRSIAPSADNRPDRDNKPVLTYHQSSAPTMPGGQAASLAARCNQRNK